MTTSRSLTMRLALRAAAAGTLEGGWLFLPSSENPGLDTVCVLVTSDGEDSASIASALGFPQEGLDTSTIEDTASTARQFQDAPSDELLLESFVYYWRFDAWLPEPGASEPPPWEETKLRLDREFFDDLGAERHDVACKAEGCSKGAVQYSVLCRIHHFEMIRKEPCPFIE
ncbi:hypothetical protein KY495_06880 [Massilia sp. PAMC28688]|uniref:DUF7716 domain-containing protein n=1 Tax=Massilia sp. PAMC28688 TaxID=2861283 RepID=UPI001C62F2E3|nr:hypothetical protein [Massilia sp. PAMC28688]QYF94898.1 hypothetical protein KY495_06880 [Massilia sp. PAMC28688]